MLNCTKECFRNKVKGENIKILKIERLKWEVVEEKKELLTEEEREFLRLYMKINGIKADKIKFNMFEIIFINYRGVFYGYINTDISFKNVIHGNAYTLSELRIGGKR